MGFALLHVRADAHVPFAFEATYGCGAPECMIHIYHKHSYATRRLLRDYDTNSTKPLRAAQLSYTNAYTSLCTRELKLCMQTCP